MKVQSIRGTHDILPGSVELWQKIEAQARRIFELYGYAEVRTPIFEETELFTRSIGVETDIVQKEMYTFTDSKGKGITLRPEGTAPVVRSYIEHHLQADGLVNKLYYIGPMFRRERPQKGRYRQFHQIGAEVLGSNHAAVEAELVEMLVRFLRELGVQDFRLLLNSVGCAQCRPGYVRKLQQEMSKYSQELCEQCLRRAESNALRVLDCKVPSCQPVIERLPSILDHLCEACREHFSLFLRYLDLQAIRYQIEPRLVRGLDYYVRTTFEIQSDRLGPTQNALLGGGRYDRLSEILDGPPVSGVGFALGMERLVLLLSGREEIGAAYAPPSPDIFLAYIGESALEEAFSLAAYLRQQEVFAYLDFEGRSLKAQMRQANRLQSRFTCIIGEEEIKTGRFTLKRMSDGEQWTVGREDLAVRVREIIG
ncbi:MAG: histidine--tRNA ligase [Acidobacteriota bacterium]